MPSRKKSADTPSVLTISTRHDPASGSGDILLTYGTRIAIVGEYRPLNPEDAFTQYHVTVPVSGIDVTENGPPEEVPGHVFRAIIAATKDLAFEDAADPDTTSDETA
jgi:hypothetical protein